MQVQAHLAKSCLEWDLRIGIDLEAFDGLVTYYFQRPISEPRFEMKRDRIQNSKGRWHSRSNRIWTKVQKVRCVGCEGGEDCLRLVGRVLTFNEFKKRYMKDEIGEVKIEPYFYKNGGNKTQDVEEILVKVQKYYEKTYAPLPLETREPLKEGVRESLKDSEDEFVIPIVSWDEYKVSKRWSDIVDEAERKN